MIIKNFAPPGCGMRGKKIFLTGKPGIGKTTIIKKWIEKIGKEKTAGFFTEEIRKKGERAGFKIKTMEGEEAILAVKGRGKFCVGKYKVNIENLEKLGVKAIEKGIENDGIEVIIIDEIGKMELFSEKFKKAVINAIESPKTVLGVITMAKNEFVDRIKERKDILIVEVNRDNREILGEKNPVKEEI